MYESTRFAGNAKMRGAPGIGGGVLGTQDEERQKGPVAGR